MIARLKPFGQYVLSIKTKNYKTKKLLPQVVKISFRFDLFQNENHFTTFSFMKHTWRFGRCVIGTSNRRWFKATGIGTIVFSDTECDRSGPLPAMF